MKKWFLFIALLVTVIPALAIQEVIINDADITNIEDKLDENEIFFKLLNGFEMDSQGYLYYLEPNYSKLYKVHYPSYKLVKTLMTKGKGPAELSQPVAMRIKNDRIFIYDFGSSAIKIFNIDGEIINEFRIRFSGLFGLNVNFPSIIDVNVQNEIYYREIDDKNNTVITVFNMEGKRLRQFVPLDVQGAQGGEEWVLNTLFLFRLDSEDNLILLYTKKGVLTKYDARGNKLWEHNLYDDYVREKGDKNKFEVIRESRKYMVKYTLDFTGICIIGQDKIFISTPKGGILYNTDAKPLCRYKTNQKGGLGRPLFIWYQDLLITPEKITRLKVNFTD